MRVSERVKWWCFKVRGIYVSLNYSEVFHYVLGLDGGFLVVIRSFLLHMQILSVVFCFSLVDGVFG